MSEVKLTSNKGTMEQRLRDRERNSGDTSTADHVFEPSQGARFHNIHTRGQGGAPRRVDLEKGGIKPGLGNPGEGSIIGTKRDVV